MLNMEVIWFKEKENIEYNLCLGQFDSLHIGHTKIIDTAVSLGNTVVFGFKNDLGEFFEEKKGLVFSEKERLAILKDLGVFGVIFANFDNAFKNLEKNEFLAELQKTLDIKEVFVGSDYRFGKGGEGDVSYLREYFEKLGVKVNSFELTHLNGEKVSTKLIKEKLKAGDVKDANLLLGRRYFVCGTTERGFQNGTKLGYKTANIELAKDKLKLGEGVYVGSTRLQEREYPSVINVGARPTFSSYEYLVEAHLIGLDKTIYNEEITVFFDRKIRDIMKFPSMEELKAQLAKDVEELKNEEHK